MLVYKPIDKRIQKTLFKRIDSLNRDNISSNLDDSLSTQVNVEQPGNPYEEILTKTCWARAFSAMYIDYTIRSDGSMVAFDNGTPFRLDEDSSLADSPLSIASFSRGGNLEGPDSQKVFTNPYRPPSGIISIQSSTQSYKSVNTTMNWKLYNLQEFNIYKEAFLKHGRTILIEYGWNQPSENIVPFKPIGSDAEIKEEFLRYYKNVQNQVLKSNGSYNCIVGVVKNFNFQAGRNGEYDCTTEIVSLGTTMMNMKKDLTSVTVPKLPQQNLKDDEGKPITETVDDFNKRFYKAQKTWETFLYKDENESTDILKEFLDSQISNNVPGVTKVPTTAKAKNMPQYYMNWGFIEDQLLNRFFGLINDEGEEIAFIRSTHQPPEPDSSDYQNFLKQFLIDSPGFDSGQNIEFLTDGEEEVPNLCRNGSGRADGKQGKPITMNYHVILNGQVHENSGDGNRELVPYWNFGNVQRDLDPFYGFQKQEGKGKGEMVFTNNGVIRNIVFSLEFFRQQFKGARDLKSAITKLWNTVSSMYGGYFEFKILQSEGNTGKLAIVDLRHRTERVNTTNPFRNPSMKSTKQDPSKVFVFPNFQANTLFKEFNIQVKINNALASAAMASSNTDVTKTGFKLSGDLTDLNTIGLSLFQNKAISEMRGETLKGYYDGIMKGMRHPYDDEDYISNQIKPDKDQDRDLALKVNKTRDVELDGKMINLTTSNNNIGQPNVNENSNTLKNDRGPYFTNLSPDDGSSLVGHLKNYYEKLHLFRLNYSEKALIDVDPIIPIEATFTIQGIAGLRVYDYLHIDYLPKIYQYFCNFMITSIDQEVSVNGWDTKITANVVPDLKGLLENIKARDDEMPETLEDPKPPPPQPETPVEKPKPKPKEPEKKVEPPPPPPPPPPPVPIKPPPKETPKKKAPPKPDRTKLKFGFFPIPSQYVFGITEDINMFSGLPNGPYRTNNVRIITSNWDKIAAQPPVGGFATPYKRWYEQDVKIYSGGAGSGSSLKDGEQRGPRWLSNGWPEPGQYDKWDMSFYLRWGCFPRQWHVVKSGDTGTKIEKMYGVKWDDILRVNTEQGLNNGMTKNNIWVGLKIAVDWPNAPENPSLSIGVGDTSQRSTTNLEAGINLGVGDY